MYNHFFISGEVLQASDELSQVFDKYTSIIIQGIVPVVKQTEPATNNLSLLDFEPVDVESASNLLKSPISPKPEPITTRKESQSDLDVLCDIFTSNNISGEMSDTEILQPISILKRDEKVDSSAQESANKLKALEELDALGQHLLRENLQSSTTRLGPQFKK